MSSHPNAILMVAIKPNDLARRTFRAIMGDDAERNSEIEIGDKTYTGLVMEESYDEGFQIAADEGDLVFFDMVTYGYGERIIWDDLEAQKAALEEWAKLICDQHNASYAISVTANYW